MYSKPLKNKHLYDASFVILTIPVTNKKPVLQDILQYTHLFLPYVIKQIITLNVPLWCTFYFYTYICIIFFYFLGRAIVSPTPSLMPPIYSFWGMSILNRTQIATVASWRATDLATHPFGQNFCLRSKFQVFFVLAMLHNASSGALRTFCEENMKNTPSNALSSSRYRLFSEKVFPGIRIIDTVSKNKGLLMYFRPYNSREVIQCLAMVICTFVSKLQHMRKTAFLGPMPCKNCKLDFIIT
jgi:hypothetical protein